MLNMLIYSSVYVNSIFLSPRTTSRRSKSILMSLCCIFDCTSNSLYIVCLPVSYTEIIESINFSSSPSKDSNNIFPVPMPPLQPICIRFKKCFSSSLYLLEFHCPFQIHHHIKFQYPHDYGLTII